MVLRISVLLVSWQFPEQELDGMFCGRMDVYHLAGVRRLSAGQAGRHGAESGILRADSGTDLGEQGIPHTGDKATVQGGRSRTLACPLRHASGHSVWGIQVGDAEPDLYTMEMAHFLCHNAVTMVLCRDDGVSKEPHPCRTDDITGPAASGVRRKAKSSGHSERERRRGVTH